MRKYLLAAAASAAIAAPAAAQDVAPTTGGYVGIEGGVLFPRNTVVDIDATDLEGTDLDGFVYENAFEAEHDMGFDVDAIAGYDFGLFRLEGEVAYKRAGIDGVQFDPELIDLLEEEEIEIDDYDIDVEGENVSVLSGMINALADVDAGFARIYAGAGVGRARVKIGGQSDSNWAYQLIGGVGVPVGTNMEAGLKYRYFRTGKNNFEEDGLAFPVDSFRSHSVLASLMFNFGRPAAAPVVPVIVDQAPPPAPAPATQVCPDGTVILATDVCPVAPPPPPPVQGERG